MDNFAKIFANIFIFAKYLAKIFVLQDRRKCGRQFGKISCFCKRLNFFAIIYTKT
jgi:hypothetical protein